MQPLKIIPPNIRTINKIMFAFICSPIKINHRIIYALLIVIINKGCHGKEKNYPPKGNNSGRIGKD